eukprot:Plantae.Rhodophyta-Purpureofilum_apyrenoidigerum.ctg13759.p1 GENE.Plantae.Rhodophyta-Purpureofilum_apyrenoidigerum.ctg13759~~Plantae.Rhodophyta-Purpureofilum_apyrenoidigerum.ctg13759.p1  ORF type:complete len:477 (-),score=111.20 Plantae.Rhodophyta-Purpureofilum_apyrenoidigerum.ctg13759:450-1880(-)
MLSRFASTGRTLRAPARLLSSQAPMPPLRVAVTGAAGAIGYALVMRIASGEMLGKDQPVILQLLEVEGEGMKKLKGVKMELDDSAFPLLSGVTMSSNPNEAFGDADYALLVGARPRGPGMERKDLLTANAKIFQTQGKALNDVARKSCLTLVVGNPANTNALVAAHNAPNINAEQFMAMTKLDQSRAEGMLAEKLGCGISDVDRMIIWGNHSSTQYPDISHASVKGKWAKSAIDQKWYEKEFVPRVQKRGAEIIDARGASSAASAAAAAIDHMNALHCGSGNKWQSSGVLSYGEYGVEKGIYYSMPTICDGDQSYRKVMGLPIDPYSAEKMNITEKELLEERDGVKDLLNKPYDKIVQPLRVRERFRGQSTSSEEKEMQNLAKTQFEVDEKIRRRLIENTSAAKSQSELSIINSVLSEEGLPGFTKDMFELMKGSSLDRKKAMKMYADERVKSVQNAKQKEIIRKFVIEKQQVLEM